MNQELKSSVKDENGPAPKSNAQPKGTSPPSSKAGSSATTASGPVSEEEIRAVLMQKTPMTIQELVAKFKARLISSEDALRTSLLRKLDSLAEMINAK